MAAAKEDVERVRTVCPETRILLGSGVTINNVRDYFSSADGFIVGTSLKKGGKLANPVDPRRVAALAEAVRSS
jgi:predicted TIM-barrel enzyme